MKKQTLINTIGVLFVFGFTVYYGWLSEMLPANAGPDELAHTRAAGFVYEHGRLAVYPVDENELHYAPSGSTRSFRPPLVYIVSAVLHHASDALDIGFDQPFRKGNALLGGFCALFLLLGIWSYTGSVLLATGLSAAFMLMPQVTFIFSYLNGEGSALMAVGLVLFSIALLVSQGVNTRTLLLFGAACGILSLCKMSAWVACLPPCLYAVMMVIKVSGGVFRPAAIVFLAFAVTGGWRVASNVYHHGIDDPFNWKVEQRLLETHVRDSYTGSITFEKLGYGYADMFRNEENFLTKTWYSFIGNLDWLRLTVGPLQYSFYNLLLALGLGACIVLLIRPFLPGKSSGRRYWFELSILAGACLLVYMYLRFNLYHDLQTQGKYILPAFPGILLIVSGFLLSVRRRLSGSAVSDRIVAGAGTAFVVLAVYVHLQALYKYVIPFYYSNAYVDTRHERFTIIDHTNGNTPETGDVELLDQTDGISTWKVTGPDPRIYIQDVNLDVSPSLILLRICFSNSRAGHYNVYWDAGQGASEQTMVKGFVPKGENIIYQTLPVSAIRHMRFDLGTPGMRFALRELAYSRHAYKPWAAVLNRLFFVRPWEDSL